MAKQITATTSRIHLSRSLTGSTEGLERASSVVMTASPARYGQACLFRLNRRGRLFVPRSDAPLDAAAGRRASGAAVERDRLGGGIVALAGGRALSAVGCGSAPLALSGDLLGDRAHQAFGDEPRGLERAGLAGQHGVEGFGRADQPPALGERGA